MKQFNINYQQLLVEKCKELAYLWTIIREQDVLLEEAGITRVEHKLYNDLATNETN